MCVTHSISINHISSNSRCPQMVASRTIGSSERNNRHSQIVAAATICGTCTHMRIISDDGHWTATSWVLSTKCNKKWHQYNNITQLWSHIHFT